MNLKIAQVIGLNTDQQAAQVTSTTRDEDTFLAVLLLVSDDAFTKGRQVLSELEDCYFDFEGTVAEKLNTAFAEAEKKLPPGSDFSLLLGVVSGKVLYLIGKGQVAAYLKRNDKLLPLLSEHSVSQLVSGFVSANDRLLLSTSSLISFLGTDLNKSLNLPIETFEEEIRDKIGMSDLENAGLAALAVAFLAEEVDIQALPEEPDQPVIQKQANSQLLVSNLKSFLIQFVLRFGVLFKRLPAYFPKSGRARLILAIVLIMVIVTGAGFKYKSSRDQKLNAQFNQILQEAKNNFDAAKGLANLNPTDAKSKLDLAKDQVNKALALKPSDSNAQNFKKQLEQDSASILQQSSVSNFPEFLNMDLVKKNFRATQMSLSGSKLLLLDPSVKTLVMIDLAKKSNQILAGSQTLGDAAFASLNGGLAFIYSKDKGILKIDTTNSKLTTVVKKDEGWGEVKDLYAFAGNVYLLDGGKNEIWKYLPTPDGYSDKREYISKDIKVDLGNALRMQIESSVYVLKKGGEILRFTKGVKDNFSLSNLPSAVKDPQSFFISSDTDNLYLLDTGNSRLLILTKTGSYKGQITGSKFATATDLVVDEVGKKVYLLEGGKIFQVDLK